MRGRPLFIFPTIGLGYLSWFLLLAGIVALLRTAGRGRSGWEVFGVIFVALIPVVWERILMSYHPQDLVGLGLVLIGTAWVLRRQRVWAGAVLGLAVMSQQFALLVLAPLFVIAPEHARWKLPFSGVASITALSLPFVVATSGRALHSVLLGAGDSVTHGGTILWESGVRGSALVFCARVLPILIAMGLALWASNRLGTSMLQPIPLVSLLATTLSLRLVFEEGLFGYKLMALAIMLVLLAVVRGWIRGGLPWPPWPSTRSRGGLWPSMHAPGATELRQHCHWCASRLPWYSSSTTLSIAEPAGISWSGSWLHSVRSPNGRRGHWTPCGRNSPSGCSN
jgi:hypothetical protein